MKEQLISFARDTAVAFVGVGLALALLLPLVQTNSAPSGDGSRPVAEPTSITNQKIVTDRLGQSLTVKSGGALVGSAGATVVFDALSVTNLITVGGSYVGITPVPTATAVPANQLYGNTPAAAKEVCKSVTIIGSATVTFPGITTPQAVGAFSIGNAGLGNADYSTYTNTAGIVTYNLWRIVAQTPVAATTAVAGDVCVKGQ